MDFDASTLVYIIAVIVYFLYSTFFNKKAPQQHNEPTETEVQPGKTVSFDDLLKEIRREQGQMERDMEAHTVDEVNDVEELNVEEERYNELSRSIKPTFLMKYYTIEV